MADDPQFVAGCRMPSNMTITQKEKYVYAQARMGCEALRDRILAYIAKHQPDSAVARRGRA